MRILPCLIFALLFADGVRAEEKEPTAIIELGGAGEWGLPGRDHNCQWGYTWVKTQLTILIDTGICAGPTSDTQASGRACWGSVLRGQPTAKGPFTEIPSIICSAYRCSSLADGRLLVRQF
jgi:hypothetical protein